MQIEGRENGAAGFLVFFFFGGTSWLLMHVIKALSDCSFPAELQVSLKAGAFKCHRHSGL